MLTFEQYQRDQESRSRESEEIPLVEQVSQILGITKDKTYPDLLKDPRWQKKRLRIFERDNWKCQGCGREDLTLVIHHLYYLSHDIPPWDYPDEALQTLCEECHEERRSRSKSCR